MAKVCGIVQYRFGEHKRTFLELFARIGLPASVLNDPQFIYKRTGEVAKMM